MSNDTQPEIRFPGFTEDWEQRKLGEVVESVGTGRSTFTNGIVQTSETPYAVLGSTSVISYDSMFDHSGDFILTARVGANAGNLYKYFGEVKISDNTVYIQANNLDFIYYLLTKYDLKRLSFGTGQPLVKASEVKNLKLNFPQKNEEQQKIGSFFKQLDDTIALHQRKLDLLKETKKGFLQKMFPKNGAKVPEIRFPGFTKDWEQRKLGDFVVDYVEKTSVQNQFPMLTSSQQKGIVLQEDYFANRQVTTENNIGYFVLPRGYFTFRSRSDNDVFVFNRNDIIDRGIISYFYPVFTLKSADSDFFLRRINNGIQRQLSIQAEGTGQHVLSLKKFKNIVAMFPSEEEQQKIGTFFKQLDDTITLHQRKLDLLKETKKGFLQKMFV
ncbi:restriction endonuclease subunit S [Enterococcus hirae]